MLCAQCRVQRRQEIQVIKRSHKAAGDANQQVGQFTGRRARQQTRRTTGSGVQGLQRQVEW